MYVSSLRNLNHAYSILCWCLNAGTTKKEMEGFSFIKNKWLSSYLWNSIKIFYALYLSVTCFPWAQYSNRTTPKTKTQESTCPVTSRLCLALILQSLTGIIFVLFIATKTQYSAKTQPRKVPIIYMMCCTVSQSNSYAFIKTKKVCFLLILLSCCFCKRNDQMFLTRDLK